MNKNIKQEHGPITIFMARLVKHLIWSWLFVGKEEPIERTNELEANRRIHRLDIFVILCCVFELIALWIANVYSKDPIAFVVPWLLVTLIMFCVVIAAITFIKNPRNKQNATKMHATKPRCSGYDILCGIGLGIIIWSALKFYQTEFGVCKVGYKNIHINVPWLPVALIIFCIVIAIIITIKNLRDKRIAAKTNATMPRCRGYISFRAIGLGIIIWVALEFSQTEFGFYIAKPFLIALLVLRTVEIIAYALNGSVLYDVYEDHLAKKTNEASPPKPEKLHESSVQRSVCFGLINYLEIIVIFACMYSLWSRQIYWDNIIKSPSIMESLSLSVVNQLTIGFGDFHPKSDFMRGVACIQGILGLLIVITNVSYYINKVRSSRRKPTNVSLNHVRDLLKKGFPKDRRICILAYGSTVFRQTNSDFTDVDVTIILKDPQPDDSEVLKRCTDQYPSLDLTFQYLSDINFDTPDAYQFGNHGVFYVKMFASARLLDGRNIFRTLTDRITDEAYNESLRRQVKEHIWRVLINKARNGSDSTAFQQYARKYLIRIMQNLYFLSSGIDYEKFKDLSWPKWMDLFSKDSVFSETSIFLGQQIYRDSVSVSGPYSALLHSLYEDSRKLVV